MSLSLYPYKAGSRSATAVAQALGITQLKREGSTYKGSDKKMVINWGCSAIDNPEVLKSNVLNHPNYVAESSNKLQFFQLMTKQGLQGIIPAYETDPDEVYNLVEEGQVWLARTRLNAHSGEGIVVIDSIQKMVDAPLYTYYIKKKSEYRVHFFKKNIIFLQQKVRRKDHPEDQINWMIRNHANGFNYASQDLNVPEKVYDAAYTYMGVTKLDFGALDIIYNERTDSAYILEVNCAPGLEGTTVNVYQEAFNKEYLKLSKVNAPPTKSKPTFPVQVISTALQEESSLSGLNNAELMGLLYNSQITGTQYRQEINRRAGIIE